MIKYKVWYKRGRIFNDLESACKYAEEIRRKTRIIVTITTVKGRTRNHEDC